MAYYSIRAWESLRMTPSMPYQADVGIVNFHYIVFSAADEQDSSNLEHELESTKRVRARSLHQPQIVMRLNGGAVKRYMAKLS